MFFMKASSGFDGPELIKNDTFSRVGVSAVEFGAFFLESTCFMNVETVITVSAVWEELALNMLKED